MGAIKRFLKKYFSIEPTIVNPFNRKSVGFKLTLKNRDEQREVKINEIISSAGTVYIKDIVPEANLQEDLGFDSLDCVELTMSLEEEYTVEISDEDAGGCRTVRDVYALVNKYMRK